MPRFILRFCQKTGTSIHTVLICAGNLIEPIKEFFSSTENFSFIVDHIICHFYEKEMTVLLHFTIIILVLMYLTCHEKKIEDFVEKVHV